MQKTGQIERTVDREFADEEAKYKTYVPLLLGCGVVLGWVIPDGVRVRDRFEKECQTLQKAAKGYADAMKGGLPLNNDIIGLLTSPKL